MTQITPLEPFVLTFPKDEQGNDVKFRFMLTLSKPMGLKIGNDSIASRLTRSIGGLDGIDSITPHGRYTVEMTIARTFDPDQVLAEVKRLLLEVQSEILKPNLVLPS